MNPLCAYLPSDRLRALDTAAGLPEISDGAVLFADVSGFTSLTASLALELGARRGAEELTRILDAVYEVLIERVHRLGGSVVTFAGDAITCFFDESTTTPASASARAVMAAFQMHRAIAAARSVSAAAATLSLHVAVEEGRVLRRLVGDPDIQLLEVMAGGVMDRVALAARLATKGQSVAGPLAVRALAGRLGRSATLHEDADGAYVLVSGILGDAPNIGTVEPPTSEPPPRRLRPWLLPSVYDRVSLGHVDFLAELRPAAVIFLRFRGLDFDGDEHAGPALDTCVRWVQQAVAQADGALLDVSAGNTTTCCYIAFGAPIAHDDDAVRAVETALRLAAPPTELDFIRDIQIGIGHGRMWAGPYGSSIRRTYGVLGDQANLAQRLMEAAPPGGILASEGVVVASRRREHFANRGVVALRGREEAVPVFEPRGRDHERLAVGRSARIIGRDKERRLLQDAIDALQERGMGGVIFIEGEPGIGKSRLIGELRDRAGSAALRVACGAASAIEPSTPYFVWRSALSDALLPTLPATSSLAEHLRAALADRTDLVGWLPLLNGILPLGIAENEITAALSGEARAESTFTLIATLLSDVARREGGLVLALEDAHWMDSVSWALAHRVSRDIPSLLLVISTRPIPSLSPDYEALRQSPRSIRVVLEPLASQETLALVRQQLGVAALPDAVAALIEEKTQGNPFFAEELVATLRDRRVIQIDEQRCEITPGASLSSLEFPDTIEEVVRSRIDQLAPSQQLLVKLASVIGRSFPVSVLTDLYPAEADSSRLQDDLDALNRAGLLPIQTGAREITYAFKHSIIQDVAYDLLLFGQKRRLHLKVAQWYESTYTTDLAPHYALLAHHWGCSRVTAKTIHYLEKAGDQALENDANEEARRFFGEAVQLVDRPPKDADDDRFQVEPDRRAQWEVRLGEAHHRMGMLAQSEHHFRDALRRLDFAVPDSAQALLRGVITEIMRQFGERVRRRRESTSAPASEAGTRRALAHSAYARLTEVSFLHGRSGFTVYGILRSLNVAEAGGPSRELAYSYAGMCVACGLAPYHPLARLYQRKAIALAGRLPDAQALADVLLTTGLYAVGVGAFEQADRQAGEAMTLFERFGNFHRWGMCMHLRCRVAWSQGDFTRLSRLTETLQQSGRRREDLLQQIWALNNEAEAALLRGDDPAVALRACEEALGLIAKCTEVAAEIICRSLIAKAEIRRANGSAALAAADGALALLSGSRRPTSFGMLTAYAGTADAYLSLCEDSRFAALGDLRPRARVACRNMKGFASIFPIGRPWAALCEARYLTLIRRQAKAGRIGRKAIADANRLRMPYEAAAALYTIGRNLPTESAERSKYLAEACTAFSSLGARYDELQARDALRASDRHTSSPAVMPSSTANS
jgi:class 3 adenylate cyclase